MIHRLLALAVALTAAQASPAQEEEKPTLDEDIEVMRQILQDRLAPARLAMASCAHCHTSPHQAYSELRVGPVTMRAGQGMGSGNFSSIQIGGPGVTGLPGQGWQALGPHDPHHAINALAQLEGAYLPGHGVVYTITLPTPGSDPRPTSPDAPPREQTEWEKVRGRLRGEKVVEKKPAASKARTVGDVVLDALAKNGKNVGIKPDERLTVVVTFRPEARTPGTGWDAGKGTVIRNVVIDDHERRGDLLLNGGNALEALHAYLRSVESARDDHNKYRLLKKVAQACIQSGQLDKGQEILDKLKAVQEEQEQTEEKAKEYNVPARLTISATRKQLEDVAAEKISVEEFRKALTVEYRQLPGKAKK